MWLNGMLVIILTICVITDIKSRKIYNNVVFPGLLLAFASQFVSDGWTGVGTAVVGFSVGLSILIIPYMLGGIGAGDVKLLAFVGASKGAGFVFYTSIYMALFGGLIALIILLFRQGVKLRLKSLFYFFYARKYGLNIPFFIDKQALTATYPYGIAITTGAFFRLIADGRWVM